MGVAAFGSYPANSGIGPRAEAIITNERSPEGKNDHYCKQSLTFEQKEPSVHKAWIDRGILLL
jgi:hypothetical protein